MRDAIESGMDACIARPVRRDRLNITIQQVPDKREEQGQKKMLDFFPDFILK